MPIITRYLFDIAMRYVKAVRSQEPKDCFFLPGQTAAAPVVCLVATASRALGEEGIHQGLDG